MGVVAGLFAASCLAAPALADGATQASTATTTPTLAEQTIPASPRHHFNDYASLISPEAAQGLDRRLVQFEKETTNQVVVAVFSELPWGPMEEFTLRTANAWGVGRKGVDNGVVLFVFVNDRRLRLEVGTGLENILTREVSQRILDEKVTPSFRARQHAAGLAAALDAIITALEAPSSAPAPP